MQTDRNILETYRQWLHNESRLLGVELYPELGTDAPRYVPETTAAEFHFPTCGDWRDVPKPSTRAELVLRAVGALPGATNETTAKARIAWHYRELQKALICLHSSLEQPPSAVPTIAISCPDVTGDEILSALRAGLKESNRGLEMLPKTANGKRFGKQSLRKQNISN